MIYKCEHCEVKFGSERIFNLHRPATGGECIHPLELDEGRGVIVTDKGVWVDLGKPS